MLNELTIILRNNDVSIPDGTTTRDQLVFFHVEHVEFDDSGKIIVLPLGLSQEVEAIRSSGGRYYFPLLAEDAAYDIMQVWPQSVAMSELPKSLEYCFEGFEVSD